MELSPTINGDPPVSPPMPQPSPRTGSEGMDGPMADRPAKSGPPSELPPSDALKQPTEPAGDQVHETFHAPFARLTATEENAAFLGIHPQVAASDPAKVDQLALTVRGEQPLPSTTPEVPSQPSEPQSTGPDMSQSVPSNPSLAEVPEQKAMPLPSERKMLVAPDSLTWQQSRHLAVLGLLDQVDAHKDDPNWDVRPVLKQLSRDDRSDAVAIVGRYADAVKKGDEEAARALKYGVIEKLDGVIEDHSADPLPKEDNGVGVGDHVVVMLESGAYDATGQLMKGVPILVSSLAYKTVLYGQSVLSAFDQIDQNINVPGWDFKPLAQKIEGFDAFHHEQIFQQYSDYVKEGKFAEAQAMRDDYRREIEEIVAKGLMDARNSELYQNGEYMQEKAERLYQQGNPLYMDNFLLTGLPHLIGEAAPMVALSTASGAVGGAVGGVVGGSSAALGGAAIGTTVGVAGTGALQGASGAYGDALAHGGSLEQAYDAATKGAVVGAATALPIGRMLGQLEKIGGTALRQKMAVMVRGMSETEITVLLTTVGNNLIAQGSYDPERNLFVGAGDAMAEGAVVSLFLGGMGAAVARSKSNLPSLNEHHRAVWAREFPELADLPPKTRARVENLLSDPLLASNRYQFPLSRTSQQERAKQQGFASRDVRPGVPDILEAKRKTFDESKSYSDRIGQLDPDSPLHLEAYLSEEYMKRHLDRFSEGASRFQAANGLYKYGPGRNDKTSFVLTRREADLVEKYCGGDSRCYEVMLGIPEGQLGLSPFSRVDFPTPEEQGLSMAMGLEDGASNAWIPGGYTEGFLSEAILTRVEKEMGYSIRPIRVGGNDE